MWAGAGVRSVVGGVLWAAGGVEWRVTRETDEECQ